MRKLVVFVVLCAAFVVPSQAQAAFPTVFNGADSPPIACEVQGAGENEGQRWCTTPAGEPSSRVASWDGTPIDVAVALPPDPEVGADGDFPLIGLYHGYGSTGKATFPLGGGTVQRFVDQGYAVFTMTDRGFNQSCGTAASRESLPAYFDCDSGYIHLLDQRYEVRDAQYLMGLLADDNAIDPQAIGAGGGSYGGAMSIQLGALKDRVRLPDGSYTPWTSPDGLEMEISATAPEITWSNLAQSLLPNGSRLDYVTEDPYYRPGNERTGVEKQTLLAGLYSSGTDAAGGNYAEPGTDDSADITTWYGIFETGGPYDTGPNAAAVREIADEISEYHSVNGISLTDTGAVDPAPALLTNGWVDDLFPVDESVGYYNRVRSAFPGNPISMFHYNKPGHPRGQGRAGDAAELAARQDEWFAYYVKGEGDEPDGGVAVKTMTCPSSEPSGATVTAENWAALAPGEVRLNGPDQTRTIGGGVGAAPQPGGIPGTDCGPVPGDDPVTQDRAVVIKTDPAPSGGYTLAGSPTVLGDYDVTGANDQIAVRLVDLESADAEEGTLVARGTWRPDLDAGGATEVFQLHPNAWKVEAGHVLALQLMPFDAPYTRSSPGTGGTDSVQQPIDVSNVQLRLPVLESPGTNAAVKRPAAKVVPQGYELTADAAALQSPRLKGSVKPKRKAVKRGRAATYTVSVKNVGSAVADDVKICPKVRKPLRAPGCASLADLPADPGVSGSERFKIRTKRSMRPKTYPVAFRITADDAAPVVVKAKLKLRK